MVVIGILSAYSIVSKMPNCRSQRKLQWIPPETSRPPDWPRNHRQCFLHRASSGILLLLAQCAWGARPGRAREAGRGHEQDGMMLRIFDGRCDATARLGPAGFKPMVDENLLQCLVERTCPVPGSGQVIAARPGTRPKHGFGAAGNRLQAGAADPGGGLDSGGFNSGGAPEQGAPCLPTGQAEPADQSASIPPASQARHDPRLRPRS